MFRIFVVTDIPILYTATIYHYRVTRTRTRTIEIKQSLTFHHPSVPVETFGSCPLTYKESDDLEYLDKDYHLKQSVKTSIVNFLLSLVAHRF